MNAISQSNFLLALGWAVLNSLWQMALLWVIYQLIIVVFKKLNPSSKSLLATAFLFTGFTWVCFTFISLIAGSQLTEAVAYQGVINLNNNEELNSWLHKTLPLASFAYIILLIIPVLNFFRNYRYVQTIRRYGLSRADVQSRLFVQRMAGQMGIKKPVYLWISELVTSPVTIGYFRPVILLPLAAVNNLSTQQLEAVLLHELSHIRRFDYFFNLIIKLIQSILYFNPFVKAFIKNIEREREKSCDEIVLQFQYEPHGYASALVQLERANHLPQALTVAASGKKNDLLHRVEWIMGIRKKNTVSFHRVAGILAAVFCFIALNALLIVSKKTVGDRSSAFSTISSPLYFFEEGSDNNNASPLLLSAVENKNKTIINHIDKVKTEQPVAHSNYQDEIIEPVAFEQAPLPPAPPPAATASSFSFASILGNVMPVLEAQKEAQISIALEASKKVIIDEQWKEVEKGIADVMTSSEKNKFKEVYKEALKNVDLSSVNTNLRLAYDNIDWKGINVQLNNALAEIKIDSLEKVYTIALSNLSELQKEMKDNKVTGIPDSDITLKSIEEKRKAALLNVSRLKSLKDKKIIRL